MVYQEIISAFALSNIFTFIATLFLSIFIIYFNKKSKINVVFSLYSFCISWWSLFTALHSITSNFHLSLLFAKLMHLTVPLIPLLFYHFCLIIDDIYNKYKDRLIIGYTIGITFVIANIVSDLIVLNVEPKLGYKYFMNGGKAYPALILFFTVYTILGLIRLLKAYLQSSGNRKNQLKYLFSGSLLGYGAGISCFFPVYDKTYFPYPFGSYAISIYVIITTYAIVKYRLMDITVAITRASIFIIVYTLILGIPFLVGFKLLGGGTWLIPMTLMAVFATVGPFIYLYFQRQAEKRLLQEQYRYQATLRHASLGMGRIKNLKKLLSLIVHVVTRTVRIEHASVYLYHEDSGRFVRKAYKGIKEENSENSSISFDNVLIDYLDEVKEPIIREEVEQRSHDFKDSRLAGVQAILKTMDAQLAVPSFIDNKLLAIIMLGRKKSGALYTEEDLMVFSILANQSALAIENAQFYEDMKRTHKQLFKAEKMATIGTMADGLSHQINNRLHAMGFIAGDVLDSVKLGKSLKMSKAVQALYEEVEEGLTRIQENVKRGGEIVEGLLKYTRKGDQGFSAVDLHKLIKASLEMAQFKIKIDMLDINQHLNGAPKVLGNFTQLQEVFFNLIDNAYDAMMSRKEELNEKGFRARLDITAEQIGNNVEIKFEDNGIGVKEEDKKKLFTPFFTTKLTSKKGTGLGLYVIRQIIEENHAGKVKFTTDYKKGSQTRILLPVALEEVKGV